MFSFFVQTLFALQGSTKRNGGSCYSSHHKLSGFYLPSKRFILVKPNNRYVLFASPDLNDEVKDQSDSLTWLQERLGLKDEQSIELAKRFPEVHTLSVEEQLQPTLDWLEQRLSFSDDRLGELVRRQPTILSLSIQNQLETNISWLQDRLQLDQESLGRVVLRLTPVSGLTQLLGSNIEENLEPTLVWIQLKLLLDDAGLRKLVEKYPSFLGLSLESHKEKVAWPKEA